MLDHERLDVYQCAIQFVATMLNMLEQLPKGHAYLSDQCRRAAVSIPLNIAEGAGEFAAADKARFYRFARRSATESAAVLDVLATLELTQDSLKLRGKGLLLRIVAMLTAIVLKLSESGSGSGSGSGHIRALGSSSETSFETAP